MRKKQRGRERREDEVETRIHERNERHTASITNKYKQRKRQQQQRTQVPQQQQRQILVQQQQLRYR